MQSSNYKIDQDSINFGGTEDSGSAGYKMSDTMGEVGTGQGSSASYVLNAGYREMFQGYISISSPGDVAMIPAIGGISGGVGNGSAVWNVKTDNPAGYQISVKSATSPALQSGSNSFADYTSSTANPDYDWSVNTSSAEFGYTVEGNNADSKFLDDGSACGIGTGNTADKCWFGFSTSDQLIVNSSAPNHPSGTDTTIKFRAESGTSHSQPGGTYTATIIVTAVAL